MTTAMMNVFDAPSASRKALKAAAVFWFVVTAVGQTLFAASVAVFYGNAAIHGRWDTLNRVMPHGYSPTDPVGNAAIGAHLVAAVVVTFAGLLQLVPSIRARAPTFHRWNGRIYLVAVLAASVAGLYLVWVRGTVGDLVQHLGISLDAMFIVAFGTMAYRTARARNFVAHRRWALRLFIVASAVWFLRITLPFWLAVNGGPVGFDPTTFTGPFLTFMALGQTLVPLAFLELYLRARDHASYVVRLATAGALVAATLSMAGGTALAAGATWLPRLDVRADRLTDEIETTIASQGLVAGVARYRDLRAQGFQPWRESEAETNDLGYQYLRSGRYDRAVAILELNVETHPTSPNTYDSLGEACLAAGRRDCAIANYEKALALAPTSKSAIAALKQLGAR